MVVPSSAVGFRAHSATPFVVFGALGCQIGVWVVLVADVAAALRLGPGRLGVLLAITMTAGVAAMVLAGTLADRWGRRSIAVLGLSGSALTFLLLSWVDSVGALVPTLMLLGASGGLMDLAANTIGGDVERHHRVTAMNWLHAGYSAGAAVGASAAAAGLILGLGHRQVFLAMAGLMTTVALTALRLPIPPSPGEPPDAPRRGGLAVLGRAGVALAAVTVAAALLTEGSFNNFLSLYTRTLFGSGVGAAAAVVALVAIAALIGRLVAGAVVRRFGERRTVGLAGAVTAAGLLLGTAGDEPMIAVAGLAAVAFGLSPVVPTAMSLAARSAPGESGRSVGVVGGVGYGALVGGPVVIGLLAEATGLRVAIGALIVAALTIAYAGLRWPPHPGAIDPEGSGQ